MTFISPFFSVSYDITLYSGGASDNGYMKCKMLGKFVGKCFIKSFRTSVHLAAFRKELRTLPIRKTLRKQLMNHS